MQKGLGIAALIVAIIAMFVPFVGTWLTVVAGLMAAFAFGPGLGLGIASIVINIVHIFFFSPLLWAGKGWAELTVATGAPATVTDASASFVFLPWILIIAQIGAGFLLYILHRKYGGRVAVSA